MSSMDDEQYGWGIHRRQDMAAVAWKNGGGITREVARDLGGLPPGWRISVADLERCGAFSHFGGYRRHFGVLGANPVVLSFRDRRITLATGDVVVFDGDEPVECELPDGPSRALNLMFDPIRWQGSLAPCRSGAWPPHLADETLAERWFVLAQGRLDFGVSLRDQEAIGPGDALRYPAEHGARAGGPRLCPADDGEHGVIGFDIQLKRRLLAPDGASVQQRS
ncbi:HutD/Ves family protein [Salinicola acroporae]|nr:HutD family protein [Salinicola acroporae]